MARGVQFSEVTTRIVYNPGDFTNCHEIMVLFILRKLIFQKRMCSHPMSDFWSDPSSTAILHVCEQRRLW